AAGLAHEDGVLPRGDREGQALEGEGAGADGEVVDGDHGPCVVSPRVGGGGHWPLAARGTRPPPPAERKYHSRSISIPHSTVARTSAAAAGVNVTVKSSVTRIPLNSFTSPRFGPPASLAMSKSFSTSRPCTATLKTRWPGLRRSGSRKCR